MSQTVTVNLQRDGAGTPWGFRLQGGRDIGAPLSIQRIFLGTPSEGELRRGDIVVRIGNRETAKLTHQDAHNLIKNTGNSLSLTVQRGHYLPTSCVSPHPIGIPPRPSSPFIDPLSNLPKTDFGEKRYLGPSPGPASQQDDLYDLEREKYAVASQPHRTFPLIQPTAKVRHDLPTGSYLRFANDPAARTSGSHPGNTRSHPLVNRANDAYMKAKIQESVTYAASNSSSIGSPVRGRSETPDSAYFNPQVVNRQYNTPINMYSPQNIASTISQQTGVQVTPLFIDLSFLKNLKRS